MPVVNGISFTVAEGEIFGLLGPNGAGKTTTILMMLGLTEISDGQVRVLGYDPVRQPLQVKRRVGYLPDAVGFYDNLTAAENLHYTGRLIGLERDEREAKIEDALDHVGLHDVADKPVETFSRGMRQRLGLAEILMKDAQIAILDEPTSGLDPQATLELLEIIRNLKHSQRHRAAVVASARPRAERLRPRRAVQRGQYRAARHGRRARPSGAGRRLQRRGRGRRDRARANAQGRPRRDRGRGARPEPLAADDRPRRAAGSGGSGGARRRPAAAAVGRGAEPRDHLHPLLPEHGTHTGDRHAA